MHIIIFTALATYLTCIVSGLSIGPAKFIQGNWYSNAVDSLAFTNWGIPGTYQEVTNMSNSQCDKTSISYAGGMAPLNNEVSMHFRGPMHLKSFAFYTPGPSNSKRRIELSPQTKRHAHTHSHQDRGVGDWVTVTMNGVVVSWINEYSGASSTATEVTSATVSAFQSMTASSEPTPSITSSAAVSTQALPTINAETRTWSRQAYYNATSGMADGLVFLNHHGGEGSGVFDYDWGMSLSYASSDGLVGAASPQILTDTLLQDQNEIVIYTDKQCQGNSCGFYRPDSVAYHGFDGDNKIFLMEFNMPHQVLGGIYTDMPAIWILNAAIARTQQYGSCNCWPQCGEWDILEILNSGNDRAKSTLHAGADVSGGPDQYFERPVNDTIKAAVVFDGSTSSGYIYMLPDDTAFGTTLTDDEVANFRDLHGVANGLSAKFVLGSGS